MDSSPSQRHRDVPKWKGKWLSYLVDFGKADVLPLSIFLTKRRLIMKSTNTVNGFILVTTLLLSASFNAYSYDFFGSDIASVLVANPDQCAAACVGNASKMQGVSL
jgi:hypothetical protein